jgi:hypothetical protein
VNHRTKIFNIGAWATVMMSGIATFNPSSIAHAADPVAIATQLGDFWAFQRYPVDNHKTVYLDPILNNALLSKTSADECFNGLNNPPSPPNPDGTCSTGIPKKNQAYVWGLTKTEDSLWFGTIANTLCLVESGYLGVGTPQVNDYWVCEFGTGAHSDYRPPKIYRYDLFSGVTEDKTGLLDTTARALLDTTVGLRSAGSLNGVAFFAGLSFISGINMFAFDTDTGAFLGSKNFPEYSDIRIWITAQGALYTSVGLSDIPDPSAPGGAVLRWVGKKSMNPNELFAFDVVGNLDAPGAYLAEHQGRIFISTWPAFSTNGGTRLVGVYQGPVLPIGGLTSAHATQWLKVWQIDQYEIDPIVQQSTLGGALASFDGELYWGTMQVPFVATQAALNALGLGLDTNGNGKIDPSEALATALGTHRSISIFRGFGSNKKDQDVKLVYGETYLPTYDPSSKSYTIQFDSSHLNHLGQVPLLGASGMGNFFNTYTWSMNTFQGRLYVGTFDWSQLARVGLESIAGIKPPLDPVEFKKLIEKFGASVPTEGADLFRFDNSWSPARAESLDGIGNFTNYGIRTMVSDERALYVGTANPMNLHPWGGWELRGLMCLSKGCSGFGQLNPVVFTGL